MSADILAKLNSSESANSLRMEDAIRNSFRNRGWDADLGVYYTDPVTHVDREIDVISRHTFESKNKPSDIGRPLINLNVLCECKSLISHNIIFIEGGPDPYRSGILDHWSGFENHLQELVQKLATEDLYKNVSARRLYKYFLHRAYPDSRQISFGLRLPPPPISFWAAGFRDTKGGDESRNSPVWNAVRGIIDATKASEARWQKFSRSHLIERNPLALTSSDQLRHDAFFFDSELMRRVLFHSVVFCRSRLFRLDDSDIEEITSARLAVKDIDMNSRYVDIVSFDAADEYIEKLVGHLSQLRPPG